MARQDNLDIESRLRERIKELSCLYEVVRLAERLDASFDEVLQGAADLLPQAWQFPDIASGRVVLDGRSYCTVGFLETRFLQSAPIVVRGKPRGRIEVAYREERPDADEGPFLVEERNLIDALAREVSGIVERHEARAERARLEEQLRHADRLATIGQMAAGVAHELNEPLGNILGFAQLAGKAEALPASVYGDIQKIIDASLHARKIVSKLRLFARQMPPEKKEVDLNQIVSEGLFLLASRCAKEGIAVFQELDPVLPRITADPGQLHQVLTNLAVNAIQAMPDGGALMIRTRKDGEEVALTVEDTGVGITPTDREKIFLPFFTTKGSDQGTGLGLSVVDSIVTTHGGAIRVESAPGRGALFEVRLPVRDPAQAQAGT